MSDTPYFRNRRINILLIVNACLLTYLTSLSVGVSSLDDSGLFQALQQGQIGITSLFTSGGGTYYRPLTMLTYWGDFFLWGTNPVAFHATNLLLHTANALLVYWLALNCVREHGNRHYLALIAALFFAVQPLNCEAVVWISGRTDLLCCLFFLLSLIVVTSESLAPFTTSALLSAFFFCSLLAKESSVTLLALIPLGLFFSRKPLPLPRSAAIVSALLLVTALYVALRSGAVRHLDKGLAQIAGVIGARDPWTVLCDTIAVAGFYLGKLVWPFPLNVAILSFDRLLYGLVGVVVTVSALVMFVRFRQTRFPLAIVFIGLVPPLLVYHADIPWMPLAERYLYLPLTGAALLFAMAWSRVSRRICIASFAAILALALSTNARVALWADPVAFWAETLRQSPGASAVRVIYAYELIKTSRPAEAVRELDAVSRIGYEDSLYRKCRIMLLRSENDLHS